MAILIRAATISDIPHIRQIAHEVWPKAYADVISAEQIAFMLDWMYSPSSLTEQMQSGIQFLLLEDSSTPMGYASFRCLQGADWKLEKLYIRSDRQKNGLGSSLIKQVFEEVKQLGGRHLELQVNRKNSSLGFYQKLGFETLREDDFDIGNGFYMNDYILGCRIE